MKISCFRVCAAGNSRVVGWLRKHQCNLQKLRSCWMMVVMIWSSLQNKSTIQLNAWMNHLNHESMMIRPARMPMTQLYYQEFICQRLQRTGMKANTFFSIKFSDALYLPIVSLDEFTRNFQRSVYDYFAGNYGTVKNEDAASDEKSGWGCRWRI